jgi:hypothetical protein
MLLWCRALLFPSIAVGCADAAAACCCAVLQHKLLSRLLEAAQGMAYLHGKGVMHVSATYGAFTGLVV